MINIPEILKKYNIKYWTEGKNVQKNWINIQCPFCNDHSNHGGFNYQVPKPYYNCWHCGQKFLDQIFLKLKIPLSELKNNTSQVIIDKLNNKITKTDFILPGSKLNENHKNYLLNRGFDPDYLETKYKLLGTNHLDKYKFRIIIPIIYNNQIISFTSRDYTDKQSLRYISCPKEMEIIEHKTILYNFDNCKRCAILIVEGIFDCWRFGDNCCATFGISYTKEQVNLLTKYETIYICFDNEIDAQKQAEKLGNELSGIGKNVFIINIPDQYKDLAEMSEAEAMQFKKELLK